MSIHNEIKQSLTTEEINEIVGISVECFLHAQCSDKIDNNKLRMGFSNILRVCEIPYEYTETEKKVWVYKMKQEELKPCKCGGKVNPWFGEKMNAFECLRCGYQTIIEIPDSTIEQAIAAWNKRQGETE